MEENKATESKTAAYMQKKARQEAEGIRYIQSRTDLNDPKVVYQVYQNLIQQNVFETTVGLQFLAKIRRYLVKEGMLPQGNLTEKKSETMQKGASQTLKYQEKEKQIVQFPEEKTKEKLKPKTNWRSQVPSVMEQKKEQIQPLKMRLKISLFFNAVLLVAVIGMFVLAKTSNHPTILNYETQMINKYEAWEQELATREQAIKEKEDALK